MKRLAAKAIAPHRLAPSVSDGSQDIFDGAAYMAHRESPLLGALRNPTYFARCFVDAGALSWPNGLELSAARLRELSPEAISPSL